MVKNNLVPAQAVKKSFIPLSWAAYNALPQVKKTRKIIAKRIRLGRRSDDKRLFKIVPVRLQWVPELDDLFQCRAHRTKEQVVK